MENLCLHICSAVKPSGGCQYEECARVAPRPTKYVALGTYFGQQFGMVPHNFVPYGVIMKILGATCRGAFVKY
jgi:hypothetical protein